MSFKCNDIYANDNAIIIEFEETVPERLQNALNIVARCRERKLNVHLKEITIGSFIKRRDKSKFGETFIYSKNLSCWALV